MKLEEVISLIRAFVPSGDETIDLETLYKLIDDIAEHQAAHEVRRELVAIFERFPDADLGSPGPIVHTLEESPIDEHIEVLSQSLQAKPTSMAVWMAERCLRSELGESNRIALLQALRSAGTATPSVRIALQNALRKYGT